MKRPPDIFELYNEPEIHWIGSDEELVKFLSVVSSAFKSVYPSSKVVGPSFASIDVDKLKRLVGLGLLNHVDGLALHAYVPGTEPERDFSVRIDSLRQFLHEIGENDLPVYLTEFGWASGDWLGREHAFDRAHDELTQAQYISRAVSLLSVKEVTAALLFVDLLNAPDQERNQGFSLLHQDQAPKPSYMAFAQAVFWLTNAYTPRLIKITPSVYILHFRRSDGLESLVAWNLSDDVVFFPLLGWRHIEDMMGRDMNLSGNRLKLSRSPLFVAVEADALSSVRFRGVVKAKIGDSVAFPYSRYWLPEGVGYAENGRVLLTVDTKEGSYLLFGKQNGQLEVVQLVVSAR